MNRILEILVAVRDQDGDDRREAIEALYRSVAGLAEGTRLLADVFAASDRGDRMSLLDVFDVFCRAAGGARDVLRGCVEGEDETLAAVAALSLWHLGADGKATFERLLRALDGGSESAQFALVGLQAMGLAAAPAAPRLERLLEATDAHVPMLAYTHWRITGSPECAVRALSATLDHGDRAARISAMWQLGVMGEAAAGAVAALKRLRDGDGARDVDLGQRAGEVLYLLRHAKEVPPDVSAR